MNTGYIALDQNPINKITAHLILILPSKNSSLNILMKAFIEKNKILFYVSEEIQEVNFFFQSWQIYYENLRKNLEQKRL